MKDVQHNPGDAPHTGVNLGWRSQDWWGARRMSRGGRKEPMQKAVRISIFPQRCQVNVESNLCFYNFKILQSNLKLKLQSRRNCNEVIPKLSQPLELNKGDPEANSKSLFFSEEMKASRTSEEKERRSYAGCHLMSICRTAHKLQPNLFPMIINMFLSIHSSE